MVGWHYKLFQYLVAYLIWHKNDRNWSRYRILSSSTDWHAVDRNNFAHVSSKRIWNSQRGSNFASVNAYQLEIATFKTNLAFRLSLKSKIIASSCYGMCVIFISSRMLPYNESFEKYQHLKCCLSRRGVATFIYNV